MPPPARATVEEIREFCNGQIAHCKIPRYVVFVDAADTRAQRECAGMTKIIADCSIETWDDGGRMEHV